MALDGPSGLAGRRRSLVAPWRARRTAPSPGASGAAWRSPRSARRPARDRGGCARPVMRRSGCRSACPAGLAFGHEVVEAADEPHRECDLRHPRLGSRGGLRGPAAVRPRAPPGPRGARHDASPRDRRPAAARRRRAAARRRVPRARAPRLDASCGGWSAARGAASCPRWRSTSRVGGPSEAPWLNGGVARAAAMAGLPAPVNATLARLVEQVAGDAGRRAELAGNPGRAPRRAGQPRRSSPGGTHERSRSTGRPQRERDPRRGPLSVFVKVAAGFRGTKITVRNVTTDSPPRRDVAPCS